MRSWDLYLAVQASVDDDCNVGDRDARLCNVGGQDDFAVPRMSRVDGLCLLLVRDQRVQDLNLKRNLHGRRRNVSGNQTEMIGSGCREGNETFQGIKRK